MSDLEPEKLNIPLSGGLVLQKMVEVLPQTERTKAMLARKREEERRKREEQEALEREKQQKEAEKRRQQAEEAKRAQEKRKKLEEEERRKREEEEQRSRLEGGLEQLIAQLKSNSSPWDVSLTGLELGPVRLRLLMNDGLANNKSLYSLDLSRRGIVDSDGDEISKMLQQNKFLGKLELEGNNLGVSACRALSKALVGGKNHTLRNLSLDNNSLTASGSDQSGVVELFKSLRDNTGLCVLSLCNNHIRPDAGAYLLESLEHNQSLTQVDLVGNELTVAQQQRIQQLLERNRERLSAIRRRERLERTLMAREEERTRIRDMRLDAKRVELQAIEQRRLLRMKERLEHWKKEAENEDAQERLEMETLMQEYEDRKEARKGKKKKKKK